MPRPLRPIDDGLIYHVINRGNSRQDVFRKPADFEAFLAAWPTSKSVSRLSSSRFVLPDQAVALDNLLVILYI